MAQWLLQGEAEVDTDTRSEAREIAELSNLEWSITQIKTAQRGAAAASNWMTYAPVAALLFVLGTSPFRAHPLWWYIAENWPLS